LYGKRQLLKNLNCNYQTERVCQEAREENFGKISLQKELRREINPLGADTDDEINQKINHCCNKVNILVLSNFLSLILIENFRTQPWKRKRA